MDGTSNTSGSFETAERRSLVDDELPLNPGSGVDSDRASTDPAMSGVCGRRVFVSIRVTSDHSYVGQQLLSGRKVVKV